MTKTISEKIKGIAILLMIAHHLFMVGSGKNFIPLNSWIPVELFLSVTGKICVGLFAFVSGYGLFLANGGSPGFKPQFRRILNFLGYYWAACIGAVILLSATGNMPKTETSGIVWDFAAITCTMSGAWWFAGPYILFLFFLPFTQYILRNKTVLIISLSLLIYFISDASLYNKAFRILSGSAYSSWIYRLQPLSLFTYIQLIFFTGYITAKHDIINRFLLLLGKLPQKRRKILFFAIIVLLFSLRYYAIDIYLFIKPGNRQILIDYPLYQYVAAYHIDFIFAPVTAAALAGFLSRNKNLLNFFGRHSINIWLFHGIIIKVLRPISNYIQHTILIFLIITGLSIFYSLVILCLRNIFKQLAQKIKNGKNK